MSECMQFPDTWEEFEQAYGFEDKKEIYTNGSRLIQSFRVKQWLDYIAEPERKTGKWINGMLYYDFDESEWEKVKCSVCKNFVVKQIFYHDNKYHFCPYCGANMRGE